MRVDQRDNSNGSATAVGLFSGASFLDGEALARTTTVPTTYGIYVSNLASEDSLLSNVTAQGGYGIDAEGAGPTTVRFARVTGNYYGIMAAGESVLVEDSIVAGGPLVGLPLDRHGRHRHDVRHVTLNGTYAGVESYVSGHTARMVVSNTAIVGGGPDPETPDLDIETGSGAVGRIEADYSFFRAAHVTSPGREPSNTPPVRTTSTAPTPGCSMSRTVTCGRASTRHWSTPAIRCPVGASRWRTSAASSAP